MSRENRRLPNYELRMSKVGMGDHAPSFDIVRLDILRFLRKNGEKGLCGRTLQPGPPTVNLAGNYLGFNCFVAFAENDLEVSPGSEPMAPVGLHPASYYQLAVHPQVLPLFVAAAQEPRSTPAGPALRRSGSSAQSVSQRNPHGTEIRRWRVTPTNSFTRQSSWRGSGTAAPVNHQTHHRRTSSSCSSFVVVLESPGSSSSGAFSALPPSASSARSA
jgi:hypothetical protein